MLCVWRHDCDFFCVSPTKAPLSVLRTMFCFTVTLAKRPASRLHTRTLFLFHAFPQFHADSQLIPLLPPLPSAFFALR